MEFCFEQHFVEAAALRPIKVKISKHYGSSDFIIINLKMLIAYLVTYKLFEIFLHACLLIWVALSKDDWHLLRVKLNLLSFQFAFNKPHDKLLLLSSIALQINLGAPLHQIHEVHKTINFLFFDAHLIKVSTCYLLHHLLQAGYLFVFEV